MQKRARSPFSDDQMSSSSPKRATSEEQPDDSPNARREPNLASDERNDDLADAGSQLGMLDNTDTERSHPHVIPDGEGELSLEEKYKWIENFKKQPLNLGDTWCLIDRKWYRLFEAAVKSPSPQAVSNLSPVDNSGLATPQGVLKVRSLVEGVDIEMVPLAAWQELEKWYGANIKVERKVIMGANKSERVEFYPPIVSVVLIRSPGESTPRSVTDVKEPFVTQFSASSKSKVLLTFAARLHYKLDPKDCRLWKLNLSSSEFARSSLDSKPFSGSPFITPNQANECQAQLVNTIDGKDETLETNDIRDGDTLALEWRTPDSSRWLMTPDEEVSPIPATGSSTTQPIPSSSSTKPLFNTPGYVTSLEKANNLTSSVASNSSSSSSPKGAFGNLKAFGSMLTRSKSNPSGPTENSKNGLMGLQNLGNTCFMNSAIQCMANTAELNQYFLSGVYKDEINRSNPLGMKGQVADAFGELIAQLFHGSSRSFSPSDFKRTIARFAPSFSGYQQHDSQEFITFLLDGLHEDLNRIKQKPYTESPDWKGGDDEELAKMARTCWELYKKRNDSVIVDLFQGQYQSTLVCPKCNKVSINFDPFMYLTLPLPIKKQTVATVHYIPADAKKPRYKIELTMPKDASFSTAKTMLAKWFDADPKKMIATELYNSTFYRFYADHELFSEISQGDVIVFYEVETEVRQRNESIVVVNGDHAVIPVFHSFDARNRYSDRPEPFGAPFFLTVDAKQARNVMTLAALITRQYERVLSTSSAGKIWVEASASLPASPLPRTPSPDDMFTVDTPPLEPVVEIRIPEDTLSASPSPPPDYAAADDQVSSPSDPVLTSDLSVDPPADALMSGEPTSTSSTATFCRPIFDLKSTRESGGDESVPSGKRFSSFLSREPLLAYKSGDESEEPDQRPLLVGPGVGLVCIWPKSELDEIFGEDRNAPFETGYEAFVDPSAPRPEPTRNGKAKKSVISIEDCLDEFSREEELSNEDLWYCPDCKEFVPAKKTLSLWKVPDILVVHLKRFSGGSRRDKIDNLIECPIVDFDLETRVGERKVAKSIAMGGGDYVALGLDDVNEPLLYDLFAVDQHYGGVGGGHYTALAKNSREGGWYCFDDSSVSSIGKGDDSSRSIVTPAAYVLFYRRKTARPIGGKSRDKAEIALKEKGLSQPPSTLTSAAPSIREAYSSSPSVSASSSSLPDDSRLPSPIRNSPPSPGSFTSAFSSTSFSPGALNVGDDDTFSPLVSSPASPSSAEPLESIAPDGEREEGGLAESGSRSWVMVPEP